MRKLHSFLLFSLAVLSFALAPSKAKASHAAGGEIIYEWISDSTYRIYFKFYRDCTGISEPDPASLCVTNTCGITGPGTGSFSMPKWTGPIPGGITNGDPVTAGCSQYKNKCDSPNSIIPGYREWWYYYLWTSDGKCDHWNFSTYVSARNFSNNIGGGDLYVETTFDNKRFEGNSSPFFSVKPIPYVCVNSYFEYNNGAIDPDGDSLWSEMIQPLTGSCGSASPVGWGSPPTGKPAFGLPKNPLSCGNSFTISGTSGQMTFTADQTGPSTLTCKVSEYKSQPGHPYRGLKIGHIMRDVQVQVLNCSTVAPKFQQVPGTLTGGVISGNRIEGCIGQRLQFDFYVKAADSDAIMTIEDNHMFIVPAAKLTYTNVKTDSLHGHFDWTPTPADAGFRSFNIIPKDSTCKPPGIMLYFSYQVNLFIWPPVTTVPDTAVCPKETAFLNALGGGNYVWSVLPGGGPLSQLSCTNCPSPVVTATQKTTYVVTSTSTAFCNNNTDTVVVDILPGLVFKPLQDVITCPNNSVVLDLKPTPPPGVKYLVRWTPGKFLSDSTKSVTTVTPTAPQTYTIVLTSSANQCKGYDTVNVDVLTGFHLDNPDTAICNGEKVQVRASADARYSIQWTDDSSNLGLFDNPASATPIVTPAKVGTDRYIMTLSYKDANNVKLCRDTSADFDIDMQPVPFVTVDNDAAMCAGDTMQMNGVVTPDNYKFDLTWTPGNSLNNPKIPNPIFSATQSTKLTLTATTSAHCTSSDDVNLTVFPAAFLFASNDTAICPGESAQLHVTGNGVKTFRWVPDVRIDNPYSYDPMVSPPATQEYRVYAVDTNFCSDTANVVVTVHPKAVVELPDSIRIYPGESYKFQPGGNCSYFSWYPPLGLNRANISNPIAQPEVNTRYFVTGVTEAGCSASDSVSVLVSSESVVDVPNAFTPGSGPNGRFRIMHLGTATLKTFEIYNRWGVKVYESTDLNDGWDGTFKGEPQPIGVYVYSVEAVTPSGRKFTKQGNLTLIR